MYNLIKNKDIFMYIVKHMSLIIMGYIFNLEVRIIIKLKDCSQLKEKKMGISIIFIYCQKQNISLRLKSIKNVRIIKH
jgi:hypothetical protein